MRSRWLIPSIAIIALAASTAYLAIQLHAAREELAAARSTTSPITTVTTVGTQAPPLQGGAGREADGSKIAVLSLSSPEQHGRSSSLLQQLRDPAGREEIYRQRKQMLRSVYNDLGRTLGLGREDADQLFELLVQQELAVEEAAAVCMSDKACRYTGRSESLALAQDREIAARFGPETLEALKFYQASGNQRQTVAALRGQLPDNARLSDAKASELVHALVEEDVRAQQDMERVGYGIAMTNNGAYVAMERDAAGAREAAATEYNQRLRDRAAGILSSEQLAIYEQMLEEAVEQNRDFQSLPSAAIRAMPRE